MRYSIETRDQIFVEQILSKNIAKNINKNLSGNAIKNFLIMLNNLLQMHSEPLENEKFK